MERQEIIEQAIKFLRNLDLSTVESLEIDNTNFSDGSTGIEINVIFYQRSPSRELDDV